MLITDVELLANDTDRPESLVAVRPKVLALP